jgi:hypothetical protein
LAGTEHGKTIESLARALSDKKNVAHQQEVRNFAMDNGLVELEDTSGTNITVQIIDTAGAAIRPIVSRA